MNSPTESNSNFVPGLSRQGWVIPMDHHEAMLNRIYLARSLLGIFIDDRFFTEVQVHNYVTTSWHLQGIVHVRKLGHIFLFTFLNPDDQDLVMQHNPVNMHGVLLVLDYWRPNVCFQTFQVHYAHLWVQLHNLPDEYFDRNKLQRVINTLGDVRTVEWNTPQVHNKEFIRVQLRVPLYEPLIAGNFIETIEGTSQWVTFKYEKVYRVCYKCGLIGHLNTSCPDLEPANLIRYRGRLATSLYAANYPLTVSDDYPLFTVKNL